MISHKNYMERIVDYYDGNLSQSESDALMAFLEQQPDLYEEFLLFGDTMPETAAEAPFKAPASLIEQLKSIPDHVFVLTDELLVAYAEKDLDAYTIKKVEEAIAQNPERKRDLDILLAARYAADKAIVYPYKNKLLRKEPVIIAFRRMMYYTTAAAAIFILAFFLWPDQQQPSTESSTGIAQTEVVPVQKPVEQIQTNGQNQTTEQTSENVSLSLPDRTNTSETVIRSTEKTNLIAARGSGILEHNIFESPDQINDSRTEYLDIYHMVEYKNALAQNQPQSDQPSTGTLGEWKDWGLGFISGRNSIKENPLASVTLREAANIGMNEVNRIATENLSLSKKD